MHYLVPSSSATQKHSIYASEDQPFEFRSCVQHTGKSDGVVPHNLSPLCIFKCTAVALLCTSCTTSVVQVMCKGTVLYKLDDKCCATTAPPTLLLSCYAFLSKLTFPRKKWAFSVDYEIRGPNKVRILVVFPLREKDISGIPTSDSKV